MLIDFNAVHPIKAFTPTFVRLAGSEISASAEQYPNALSPTIRLPEPPASEKTTVLSALHLANALLPSVVRFLDNVAFISVLQSINALPSITVTESGIVISVSEAQPSNALAPIVSSPSLSVKFKSAVQPANALVPIDRTLPATETVVSEAHPLNISFSIFGTPSDTTSVFMFFPANIFCAIPVVLPSVWITVTDSRFVQSFKNFAAS